MTVLWEDKDLMNEIIMNCNLVAACGVDYHGWYVGRRFGS